MMQHSGRLVPVGLRCSWRCVLGTGVLEPPPAACMVAGATDPGCCSGELVASTPPHHGRVTLPGPVDPEEGRCPARGVGGGRSEPGVGGEGSERVWHPRF